MRFHSLLMILVLLALSTAGCDQSDKKNPQAISKPPVSPVDVDPWAVALSEMMALVVAPDDERDGHLVAISLRGQDTTLADLAKSEDAERLERINGHSAGLNEVDMAYLAEFPNLKKLTLNVNSKITDDSLRHLKGLGELRILTLFFCPQLTGSGFEHRQRPKEAINDESNGREIDLPNQEHHRQLDRQVNEECARTCPAGLSVCPSDSFADGLISRDTRINLALNFVVEALVQHL